MTCWSPALPRPDSYRATLGGWLAQTAGALIQSILIVSAPLPRETEPSILWLRRQPPRITSPVVVLVAVAPPEGGLVASFRGAVKPRIHPPDPIHPARIGGIG